MESNTEPMEITGNRERFFRRLDWGAFWTACIISFVVYVYTLAPTVTMEDSGELAVASDYLGVPHPPGYPIWTVITWLFTRIFSFVTFRGQPNPAWGVNMASAVFGALAAGMSALLISRSGSHMLRSTRRTSYPLKPETENMICWISSVAASLLFAFSPVMWSQSVIAEVYSLNAFFLILVFLLTYKWLCQPSDHLLYATAFIFGLGLTNYQVLLLAALPLFFAVFLKDLDLFRDFLITGSVYIIVLGMIKFGYLPPIPHPAHQHFIIYLLMNFIVLMFAFFLLPRGKTVAITFLLLELGVAFYGIMPLLSDLRNPPMNWGYPRTWRGFKHAISRGQYEQIQPVSPVEMLSPKFFDQIGGYFTDLRKQFTLPVAVLGFLPFTMWDIKLGKRRYKAFYPAIFLCLAAAALALLEEVFFRHATLASGYKPLLTIVLVFAAVGVITIFVNMGKELIERLKLKSESSISERILAVLALAAVALVYLGFAYMVFLKIQAVCEPLADETAKLSGEQYREILLTTVGFVLLVFLPPALVAAIAWLNTGSFELDMTLDGNNQKWIIAILLGFLSLSVILIILADPTGDIQDSFIQRVKFISSHALYAFWIGYGIIFGLAFVDRLFKGDKTVKFLTIGFAGMLSLIPIHQNYTNTELVRRVGGAEQDGHDFGWQFGNYQLRGAEAIIEELDPEDEPPPNPSYPASMTTNAVFFGGTDPGRFVPTYMIYSARVREDVYLITQNALADNTYLNVMRDLYGDQIWIPSETDSAMAFNKFVQDVQTGRRHANAGITFVGGKVQITGALGVMQINAMLAEQIFEHNNFRHNFYVEESYVMEWMYPYMEPHGLILKVNNNRIPGIPNRTATNDMDFWDWYTKRLVSNVKFRRDVVARKSFSKLRSAIAGLYSHSNSPRPESAEQAFHEARALYPLSPEANFRLAQEVYWPQMRLDDAHDLMQEFSGKDPQNTKAEEFVRRIRHSREITKQIRKLREELGDSPAIDKNINKMFNLASLYLRGNFMNQFMQLMNQIVSNKNLPAVYHYKAAELLYQARKIPMMLQALELCWGRLPDNVPKQVYLQIVRMYAKVRQPTQMSKWLKAYLDREPGDWKAWLDYAKIQLSLKNVDTARKALDRAASAGGEKALQIMRGDPAFQKLMRDVKPRKPGMLIPGKRSSPGRNIPFR